LLPEGLDKKQRSVVPLSNFMSGENTVQGNFRRVEGFGIKNEPVTLNELID
jgi:hypothetical protein